MKKITLVALAVVMVVALIAGSLAAEAVKKAKGTTKQGVESAVTVYSCPMHAEVTSDKPGKCPECGMFLEKKQAPAKKTAAVPYVCPMHPEVTSDAPGKCPECKMKLEKPKAGAGEKKAGKNKECSHSDMQCH